MEIRQADVAVIGGGFTGLTAAYALSAKGYKVIVIERDAEVGGLAGSFTVEGVRLEKFYHHWFTSDVDALNLVEEVGLGDKLRFHASRTGFYHAGKTLRLSSPLDLLRFSALSFPARVRMGFMALRARRIKRWQALEDVSAMDWLRSLGGDEVFETVWGPLLRGKFGAAASDVSAVWMWNKLKLRGSSRGKHGKETLFYLKGGFETLLAALVQRVESAGGKVMTGCVATGLETTQGSVKAVLAPGLRIVADHYIATAALPVISNLLQGHVEQTYQDSLARIRYLANVCLVLVLDRSLSTTYWLNVSDPEFPFVGIIEHTNFEPPGEYGGKHIVYMSRYLPESDRLFSMDAASMVEFALPHIKRMFPAFERSWINECHLWRERYSQPIVAKGYSALIPPRETPLANFSIATMAQIYPEDRGTNYAIREGKSVAEAVAASLASRSRAAA